MLFTGNNLPQNTHSATLSCFPHVSIVLASLTKNSLFLILNFCTLKEQWLLCACHFLSEPLCGIYYVKYVGLS